MKPSAPNPTGGSSERQHNVRNTSPLILQAFQVILVICFFGSYFGTGFLRQEFLPGIEILTIGFRKFLVLFGYYLVWVFAPLAIAVQLFSPGSQQLLIARLKKIWPLFFLFVFMLLQALSSPESKIASERLTAFRISVIPAMLVAFCLSSTRGTFIIRAAFIAWGLMVILLIPATGRAISSLVSETDASHRYTLTEDRLVLESDTTTTASHCFMAALAAILAQIGARRRLLVRVGLLGLCGLLMVIGFWTASRGPPLAFAVAALTMLAVSRQSLLARAMTGLVIVSLLLFAFLRVSNIAPDVVARYGITDDARLGYFSAALAQPATLLGHGVGSFWTISGQFQGEYAHCAMLEAYTEMGILGFTIYMVVMAYAFLCAVRTYRASRNPAALFCLSGLTYYFVRSQLAGHLFAQTGMFVFAMLAICLSADRTLNNKASLRTS